MTKPKKANAKQPPMHVISFQLPEETLQIIDREAKKRKCSRSRYVRDMIMGTHVHNERQKTGESPDESDQLKKVGICLPEDAAECLDQLAAARHMSRSKCIREIIQNRIVATDVYLKLDLTELQPFFEDLGIIASGMQELVLRPDRTPEEQEESRSIQKQMLAEIRKIRIRMEEWGDTKIGNIKKAFAAGEGLWERPGLSDVSVG